MTGRRRIHDQRGLALLGSLLLVSMLAVMSTAFLLIMAADLRIGQSHHRATQSFYDAESASQLAAYLLTWDNTILATATSMSSTTSSPLYVNTNIYTWASGDDSLSISLAYPSTFPSYKRLLIVQGYSGKASFDSYDIILLPEQDPRLYYSIAAGVRLDLDGSTEVYGGEGIWFSSQYPDASFWPASIDNSVTLESPSSSARELYTVGQVLWGGAGIHTDWSTASPPLDVYTGMPSTADPDSSSSRVPEVLYNQSPGMSNGWDGERFWYYRITGSGTTNYKARELTSTEWSSGSYDNSEDSDNPMGILVWRGTSNQTFSGNFTLNGTLVCLNEYNDLTLSSGTITITGQTNPNSGVTETYPAIVSYGDFNITGTGTRTINGLVYVRDTFYVNPTGNSVTINGAVIGNKVQLLTRTVVNYSSSVYTMAPAFMQASSSDGRGYATLTLHRHRYVYAPWGY